MILFDGYNFHKFSFNFKSIPKTKNKLIVKQFIFLKSWICTIIGCFNCCILYSIKP